MKFVLPSFLVAVCVLCISCSAGARITGEARLDTSWDLDSGELDYGLELDLEYHTSISDRLWAGVELTLRFREDTDPLRIREIYLEGFQAPWDETDFRLGYIQIPWGASDILSPVDVVNPIPLSPGIGEGFMGEKIPVPAVQFEWYHTFDWSIELVYQPYFTPNVIPEPLQKGMLAAELAPLFEVSPADLMIGLDYSEPATGFGAPLWGVRTRGHIGSVDVALSYHDGYYLNPFPSRVEVMEGTAGDEVYAEVHMGYPRRRMLGLEFQGELRALPGATFRGDVALFIPERWSMTVVPPDPTEAYEQEILTYPYWKAALGMDYTTDDDIYLNLIYSLGTPFEEGDDVSSYLFLQAERESSDGRWKPFITSGLSLADGSMVNALGISYKPDVDWNITLTASFSSGPQGSKLGDIGDGVFLTASYVF